MGKRERVSGMATKRNCVKEIRNEGSAVVVALTGEVDLHHTPEVHRALVSVVEKKPALLVINLAEVRYMDSSGIGTLVEVLRRVAAYQGKLALCHMNDRVHSVFEITKLDHFFKIFDTEAEALAA